MFAQCVTELMETTKTVLIAEDNDELAFLMAEAIGDYGIKTHVVREWRFLGQVLNSHRPNLILLDQRLGDVSTLKFLSALRHQVSVPILLMSGSANEVDRLVGLDLGADDVLQRPISARELGARVNAHLRRETRQRNPAVQRDGAHSGWVLSERERRLYHPNGSVVGLTAAEFDLLAILVPMPGVPVNRAELTSRVLKREFRATDRALDTLVCRVRRKLGCTSHSDCIVSVRNSGYVFVGFPQVA